MSSSEKLIEDTCSENTQSRDHSSRAQDKGVVTAGVGCRVSGVGGRGSGCVMCVVCGLVWCILYFQVFSFYADDPQSSRK